ncbi:MAG: alpha-galactosidase [Chitinophagaceae bacterium]|nr:alpha-galactosidase [Chitinophagaceae bacterium]
MRKTVLLVLFIIPLLVKAQLYKAGNLQLQIEGKDESFSREVHVFSVMEGVYEMEIILKAFRISVPKPIVVTFKLPSIDIQSYLCPYGANATKEPTSLYNFEISRMLPVSFAAKPIFTSAMMDQPSVTFINNDSRNRLTMGVSELIYPVTFKIGENEENGVGFDVRIGLFEYLTKSMEGYKVKIRFDIRDVQYNQSQSDLLNWWQKEKSLVFAPVPKKAHKPFYCTWYALKADGVNASNVELQASLARKLGCETIIVDDGWQKAQDAKGGYCLYNGDWEVDTVRFKDFKGHVRKVQKSGMSYMLWVGPSMIGEKSKAYEHLKDKMLYKANWASAWVVDPRFPEVRKYLSQRLISLLKESGIDGFKIDFMDLVNSRYPNKNIATGDGRDYESIEEAAVRLLADIYEGCRAVNPDVLIEYRQFYTNPVLQQYAHMFRAIDCPNDIMENRTRTLDARNLNRQVIHADPLAWNEHEKPEHSALQLLHTMLSVPQVSTDLTKMNASQFKMLHFLLEQWSAFNEVLTRGKAINYGPQAHYSWSEVSLKDETVIVAYQPTILTPQNFSKKTMLVNGTHQDNLVLDLSKDHGLRTISVYNCTGDLIRKQDLGFSKGLLKIAVPASGIVRIDSLTK